MKNTFCFSSHSMNRLHEFMHIQKMVAGSFIFHEGDPAGHYYYIVSGSVRLHKQSDQGKQLMIDWYMPGDLFGQFEDFDSNAHVYSGEVHESGVIGMLPKKELEEAMVHDPLFAMDWLRWMSVVHRITQSKFRDLMLYGKPGALCSVLIRLANTHGAEHKKGTIITDRITHNQLGEMIGATRESVNRMLSDLKNANAIEIEDGCIIIKDLAFLKDLCQCEECSKQICRM